MLGGELFRSFSQQEREEIWIRLQSSKGLVPSLLEFFEDARCLEAWAECSKWLVCPGPRETLSTAMNKIYTGMNQSVDSGLVQENETTFESVPANSARRIDLGYRQLCAFAMRYHREIPKKPSGKDLLAKPRATLDTTRSREMADLANHLGFESSEITALKRFPNLVNPLIVRGNENPALVTDGPGEIRKNRCGMPHAQNYEKNREYLDHCLRIISTSMTSLRDVRRTPSCSRLKRQSPLVEEESARNIAGSFDRIVTSLDYDLMSMFHLLKKCLVCMRFSCSCSSACSTLHIIVQRLMPKIQCSIAHRTSISQFALLLVQPTAHISNGVCRYAHACSKLCVLEIRR